MVGKSRVKKRPSAKNKVRKIGKDLLSSQFSQQQSQLISQYSKSPKGGIQTPVRKTKAPNALVKQNRSIFSPKKPDGSSSDDENVEEYDSISDIEHDNSNVNDADDAVIEIESDYDDKDENQFELSEFNSSKKVNSLTEYSVPLNTRHWQPLPIQVHSELSTLLTLLIPPEVFNLSPSYNKSMEHEIIRPLVKKFGSVYLPSIHKNIYNRIHRQRTSGEFNLKLLHQEQTKLSAGYDINSRQLDMLSLQLLKEKEIMAAEKKYLQELKEKTRSWRSSRDKRLERLKLSLGENFTKITDILGSNSRSNCADDINLVSESDELEENISDEEEIVKKVQTLNQHLDRLNQSSSEIKRFQSSVRQLLERLDA
jgi:hypothetical protein